MLIKIKLENESCTPTRVHKYDAGADLISKNTVNLYQNVRQLIGTGVFTHIPENYVGLLFPRSSLSKYGVTMTNSVGVIDSEYRGEIKASLIYNGPEEYITIDKGTRIVQLVIVPIVLADFEIVESLEETNRSAGGFGS